MRKVTGIVLAGGNSSRMGTDKAFVHVEGRRIIDHVLLAFKRLFEEIIIVTNSPEAFRDLGVRIETDAIKGAGPLGGLYTGLRAAQSERCFAVACDMPFINEALVKYMTDITGYDVVVPMIRDRYEPLFACYSAKCADYAWEQIQRGRFKISDMLPQADIRIVREEEIRIFDKELRSFININTREELLRYGNQSRSDREY